jgi:hypothetical protein
VGAGVLARQVLGPADAGEVDAVLLADEGGEAVADPGRELAVRAAALVFGPALRGGGAVVVVGDAVGAGFGIDRDRAPVGLCGGGSRGDQDEGGDEGKK